jgi:FixJ family two-component response regulator
MSDATGKRNSLGLGRAELLKLLNDLDQLSAGEHASRIYARWPYRVLWVDVRLEHPGGTDISVRIACRNLSSGGIGLLHNSYVYPDTMCTVWLPHPKKRTVAVQGRVVRCQHVRGKVHEIGVQFEEPLDPREFIPKAKSIGRYTRETVDSEQLKGTLLYVDPSEMSQNIVGHFLRQTGMTLKTASSAEEAMEPAKTADILLIEEHVGEVRGVDLVRTLRSRGVRAPCMLTSIDGSCMTDNAFTDGVVSAFLPKPIQADLLIRAIDDFVASKARRQEPEEGELSRAQIELREMFREQTKELTPKIEAACSEASATELYKLCLRLKGSAPAVGEMDLGQLAGVISSQLETSETIDHVREQVNELLELCREVMGESG